jgi:hypothetical protein
MKPASHQARPAMPLRSVWRAITRPLRGITSMVGASGGAPVARPGQSVDADVSHLSNVPRSAEQRPRN